MKNLITVLAALTLAGCYKEPKQPKPKKDTNPKIGIYGHLVDSIGQPLGNGEFYTSTISPSTLAHAASAMLVSQFNFRTNANGDFHVTVRVKEEGDSIYIYPDTAMRIIRAASFKVNPPIEKWIELGTLPVLNYYK